ncbi:hypothetical protein DERP_013756 [Dermatophagoides pteronyssinus]|uniref:Uncharacterized protein n=1 Tax=Dermatophagoides pteronyssinus TaxID=6956 RepID=A0ABQ8JFV7_DERPT|nr:hypothetical protein DERP_013756 [Dermatophagoides pteronyssinus]
MFRLLLFIDNYNKQNWSHWLMIGVIITMNDVWMANGDKSFIMRGFVGKTEWDTVRYPYKSFYETKQFCCFVWQAMACEIEKAAKCNQNYSQQIETNTRQLFTSVCDKISSSQRSWNCFWTEDMIIIAGVVATVITFLLIAVSAYLGCRQYRANAKLKAQAANKLKFSTKNLTTADTGPPTRTFRSNKIPTTTTVDHIDKPVQNVEKQGKFKKWFGKIFPSSSSKPNKNGKLTAKNVKNKNSIDKPVVELSEWNNTQTPPKKINVQHVQSSDDEFITYFNNQLSHPFNIISDEDYYAECWLVNQSDSGIAPFRYRQFRQSNILNVGGGGESSTSAVIPPPPPPPSRALIIINKNVYI